MPTVNARGREVARRRGGSRCGRARGRPGARGCGRVVGDRRRARGPWSWHRSSRSRQDWNSRAYEAIVEGAEEIEQRRGLRGLVDGEVRARQHALERERARRLQPLGLERPDEAEPHRGREDAAQRRADSASASRSRACRACRRRRRRGARGGRGARSSRARRSRSDRRRARRPRRAAPASARPCVRLARLATWLVERRVEERVELRRARRARVARATARTAARPARACQSTLVDERLEVADASPSCTDGLEPRGVREAARRETRRRRAGGEPRAHPQNSE